MLKFASTNPVSFCLERFTRNLHKLKNKIVKGTENCKNLREKVRHTLKSELAKNI